MDAKVIATGGLGKVVYENTKSIEIYDGDLTLKGLQLIYSKQKNREKYEWILYWKCKDRR